MLNVLILEDDQYKAGEIISVLRNVNNLTFKHATSIQTARQYIAKEQFDLFITDLLVPSVENGKPGDFISDFLQEIQQSDFLNSPTTIIGLTAYQEVLDQNHTSFHNKLFVLLKYEQTSTIWSDSLKNHVTHLAKATLNNDSEMLNYNVDLLVLCALRSPELEMCRPFLNDHQTHNVPGDNTIYVKGSYLNQAGEPRSVVLAHASEMGMPATAILATKALAHFRPRNLVMTGICGGNSNLVNMGDVIVADPCWNYECGKWVTNGTETEFKSDVLPQRADAGIISQMNQILDNKEFLQKAYREYQGGKPTIAPNIHIGTVTSGSAVIADKNRRDSVFKQSRKILGFDMETYAIYLAAVHSIAPRPKAVVIKSVCDFGDPNKGDDFQQFCATMSALTTFEWAKKFT